jgi:hypothetical protein
VEKLQYHVSILKDTVNFDDFPVEYLILSKDWTRDQLDKAHDIFERWDEKLRLGEKMSYSAFEHEFHDELGVSYQGLKSVIRAFYKNGQWTDVCEAFVDDMGPHPSVEYHFIRDRKRA